MAAAVSATSHRRVELNISSLLDPLTEKAQK
jgi:hypothetical protein